MKQMNIRQAKLVETFQYRVGNNRLKNNTLEFYGWTVCANTQLLFMVAYFCHHLSDNYVDLSDLYVDLSDLYVDLSLIPSVEK